MGRHRCRMTHYFEVEYSQRVYQEKKTFKCFCFWTFVLERSHTLTLDNKSMPLASQNNRYFIVILFENNIKHVYSMRTATLKIFIQATVRTGFFVWKSTKSNKLAVFYDDSLLTIFWSLFICINFKTLYFFFSFGHKKRKIYQPKNSVTFKN